MTKRKKSAARGRTVRPSRSGWNESELARRTGYSASTIHRVLAGERTAGPALGRALRMCGVKV